MKMEVSDGRVSGLAVQSAGSGGKGFSLVELMITVAILAILATVAIPMYSNYVNRAKQSYAIIGLKAAQMAEEQYFSENNVYCSTIDMLPGFSDTKINNLYEKGDPKRPYPNENKNRVVYILKELSQPNVTSGTNPHFLIEAVWKDTSKGIEDRWWISDTIDNPKCDTTKVGIKGYSVFEWLFD